MRCQDIGSGLQLARQSKVKPVFPKTMRQLFCSLNHFLFIISGNHYDGVIAWFIGPGISDPDSRINNSRLRGSRCNCACRDFFPVQFLCWSFLRVIVQEPRSMPCTPVFPCRFLSVPSDSLLPVPWFPWHLREGPSGSR